MQFTDFENSVKAKITTAGPVAIAAHCGIAGAQRLYKYLAGTGDLSLATFRKLAACDISKLPPRKPVGRPRERGKAVQGSPAAPAPKKRK